MFANNINMNNVKLSSDIKAIGDRTFNNTNVTKQVVEDILGSVTSDRVGTSVFGNMRNSEFNTLNVDKNNIRGDKMFENHPFLQEVNVNFNVISSSMFINNSMLQTGTVYSKYVDNYGFYNCSIGVLTTSNIENSLYMPSLMVISPYAFANNSKLTTLILTNEDMVIHENAFANCNNISNVIMNTDMQSCYNALNDKENIHEFTSLQEMNADDIVNILQNSSSTLTKLTIYGDKLDLTS
jgi:hypothetical protein